MLNANMNNKLMKKVLLKLKANSWEIDLPLELEVVFGFCSFKFRNNKGIYHPEHSNNDFENWNIAYHNLWDDIYDMNFTLLQIKDKLSHGDDKFPGDNLWSKYHCVRYVQIRSYFWSVFSCIRTEYGELRSISPYSVRIQESTDQK